MLRRLLQGSAMAATGAAVLLATRPNARSVAVRLARRMAPDPATRRGVAISTAIYRGAWTKIALRADLSRALSIVAGRPLAAVAYSHFGGFGDRPFAALLDPESPYYQAWLGAYAVFADGEPAFGYDESKKPVPEAAMQRLEADQRLVLAGAGLMPVDDPRPRVKLVGDLEVENVISWAGNWVRVRGKADTFSSFERGSESAHRYARWLYGVAPRDPDVPVRDFHPITCHGSLWYRFEPALGATIAKFYVYSQYTDNTGRLWERGKALADECEGLMDGIRFDRSARQAARSLGAAIAAPTKTRVAG